MVSRENKVVFLFATIGSLLWYGGRVVTSLSDTVLIGILLFVGVIAPQLLNTYLDNRERKIA
jgi:low temperature requirement protein LtrA